MDEVMTQQLVTRLVHSVCMWWGRGCEGCDKCKGVDMR